MGFSTTKYAVSEEEYKENLQNALDKMDVVADVNAPDRASIAKSGVEKEYVDKVKAALTALKSTLCKAEAYPYYEKGAEKSGKVTPYNIKFSVYKTKGDNPENRAKALIGSKNALEITLNEDAEATLIRVSTATKEITANGKTFLVADNFKPFDAPGVKIPSQFRKMIDTLVENGFENVKSESLGKYKYPDIPDAVKNTYGAYKDVVRAKEDKTADGKAEYYMSSTGEKDEEGNYYDDKIRPLVTKDGETYYQFTIRNHQMQALQIAVNEDGSLRSGSLLDYNDLVDDGSGKKTFKDGGNIYRTNLEMLNGFDSGFSEINKEALVKVGYQAPEQPKDKSKDAGKDER